LNSFNVRATPSRLWSVRGAFISSQLGAAAGDS
jgi:hypothetical protein